MVTKRVPVRSNASPPEAETLPRRQLETLDGLLEGKSEKQVAAHLGISHHTVHCYVKVLYRHFGVNSRAQLLAKVLGAGAE